jgi:enoyl-CoA hydratase/carnithine racemase
MRQYEDLNIAREGHVGIIEICKPPYNFFDIEMIRHIADMLELFDLDDQIRTAVLCASGKTFCAGADFASPASSTTVASSDVSGNHLYKEALRLFRTSKVLVAAVHGAAIGGGLGLALAADFRITCPEARFSANFARLGFHPGFGLTVTLPELVGQNAAELLLYTGRRIGGEEAVRMGLANQCVPQMEVRAAAIELAREIAVSAPLAVAATRETMRNALTDRIRRAIDHELAQQTRLRATADFREGVAASKERRDPVFNGR